MSERTLKGILVALAALVLLYAAVQLAGRLGGGGDSEGGVLAAFLERARPEAVEEVVLVREADTLHLRREDGRWLVNGYEADTSQVRRFWQTLEEATPGDLVARNPANHERLGVTDEKALRLVLHRPGGEEDTLLVGEPGPGWTNAYVRLPGQDEVFLLRGDLRSHLTRGLTQWRNRLIVALDTTLVRRLTIHRDGKEYTLRRDTTGWRMGADSVTASRVRSLLGELAMLQATDFAPDTFVFPASERSLVARGESDDTLAALDFAKGEGVDWWVRLRGRETVYRLSSWRTDRLTPADTLLRPR